MFPAFYFSGDLGVLILRAMLGVIFIVHGFPKIKNLKTTGEGFGMMGFRPGIFWGTMVGLLEFFGGIALILGFLVQPLAFLFCVEFLTICIWKVKNNQMFIEGKLELDLLILAAVFFLFTVGAGAFSLDSLFLFGTL